MVAAGEYRRTTCFDLRQVLMKFMDDHKSSSSVEHRWLASALSISLDCVVCVENNDLSPTLAQLVRDFRLSEIKVERAKHEAILQSLQDEATGLRSLEWDLGSKETVAPLDDQEALRA